MEASQKSVPQVALLVVLMLVTPYGDWSWLHHFSLMSSLLSTASTIVNVESRNVHDPRRWPAWFEYFGWWPLSGIKSHAITLLLTVWACTHLLFATSAAILAASALGLPAVLAICRWARGGLDGAGDWMGGVVDERAWELGWVGMSEVGRWAGLDWGAGGGGWKGTTQTQHTAAAAITTTTTSRTHTHTYTQHSIHPTPLRPGSPCPNPPRPTPLAPPYPTCTPPNPNPSSPHLNPTPA